jgi:glycosyltransferase involved in cell wall biosynthesis
VETHEGRIIQVSPAYPPTLGGAEQVVQTLSEFLADRGFDVTVFTSQNGGEARTTHPQPRLTVQHLRSFTIARVNVIPSLFAKLLPTRPGDVLHVHIYQPFCPEVVSLISLLKRAPYVAHIHIENEMQGPLGVLLPAYRRVLLGPTLRRARKVICLTQDYAGLIVTRYRVKPSRIAVIPNATSFSIAASPKEAISGAGPVHLLFVGRLSEQKNIPMLFEALEIYRDKFDDKFELEIVGDGELRHSVTDLVRRSSFAESVTLSGPLFGDDLERAYERSDIFVLPTSYESFGRVYIEAMAKGLPIVTTGVAGVRNVVIGDRNGLLSETSADSFCDALREMITNIDLYRRVSIQNLEDVRAYNWDRIVDRIVDVYSEIARP